MERRLSRTTRNESTSFATSSLTCPCKSENSLNARATGGLTISTWRDVSRFVKAWFQIKEVQGRQPESERERKRETGSWENNISPCTTYTRKDIWLTPIHPPIPAYSFSLTNPLSLSKACPIERNSSSISDKLPVLQGPRPLTYWTSSTFPEAWVQDRHSSFLDLDEQSLE